MHNPDIILAISPITTFPLIPVDLVIAPIQLQQGVAPPRSSSTRLALQRRRPVRLPHHRVLQTHRAPAALLLRMVPVYVSHAHPPAAGVASPGPRPGRLSADRPLGVVLAGLEGERLPRRDERDVQDLPAPGAVGGEDARGANPELDQEVGLEGGGHPAVVKV